jgi:hypothetical protein
MGIRSRQLARLEKLAQPYIKGRQRIEEEWQELRQGAAAHAAVLAFLIRYGEPTIDEPLSCAWQRCSESRAWRECGRRFPMARYPWRWKAENPLDSLEEHFPGDNRTGVRFFGIPLRHWTIASFPGADEKESLNKVFASAPPWLIWFAFGDYAAKLLGLTLPDLSTVAGFARSKADFDLWPGFPSGVFERRPWPDGPDNEPLARTDLQLLRPEVECPDGQMTPRERRREDYMKSHTIEHANDWPSLDSSEFLEMPMNDQFLAAGYPKLHVSLLPPEPDEW